MTDELTIRPITPDEREAGRQLRVMAFGTNVREDPDPSDTYCADDRRVCGFLGDRMVVHAAAWQFGQWFLGRRVPMAGIGGVAVVPDVRRRGYGPRVLRALVETCLEDGDVVSSLMPSLPGLYRRLGWENGGHGLLRRMPTAALTTLPPPPPDVSVRMLDRERDVPAAIAVLDRVASKGHGTLERGPDMHARRMADDDSLLLVVAERDGRVTGFLSMEKAAARPGDEAPFRIEVHDVAADDHDSWLALWSLVGSNAPVCDSMDWMSRPHDPLVDKLPTNAVGDWVETTTWMFRLLDAPGAIAARGWPAGVDAEVHLRVNDTWLERNDGDWVLLVRDGEGSLEPGGTGTVALDISTFASLYTGYALPVDLAWQGRLAGATSADVGALTDAFRSPWPWTDTYF